MKSIHRFSFPALAAILAIAATFASHSRGDDLYIWAVEQGGSVTFYHEGSIDLSGFPSAVPWQLSNYIKPASGEYFGVTKLPFDTYSNVVPEGQNRSFGPGIGAVSPDTESGDTFLLDGGRLMALPAGYVSGRRIFGKMIFNGETLQSLGVNPGPFTFDTTVGNNTIHFFTVSPGYVTWKAATRRAVKKVSRQVKVAARKKQVGKLKRLKKKLRKLRARLKALS